MAESRPALRRSLPVLAFLACAAFAATALADVYDDAVAHQGRPERDLKRDQVEHPAEVLRLSGIKPGMKVGDFLGADGYYAELVSYVVGPKGHVYILNNQAYDAWSENHWQERISGRLPNVEHKTIDAEHMDVPDHSLDALLVVKVYHDLYWVDEDPKDHWPKYDVSQVLSEMSRVLKPGGILLLVDHSAKPGTGSSAAGPLHRIDEVYTKEDFAKHGFKVVATSDVLRRPDDPRDQITYKGPMLGKTDRFVLVLKKTS
ncbi:MAG TPA: methyltransferase domain-containing protein [Steroidobacteraceae bacterium]|nr:methyltransferase domain-containing protein [Steroidobacteraceae bacterium]